MKPKGQRHYGSVIFYSHNDILVLRVEFMGAEGELAQQVTATLERHLALEQTKAETKIEPEIKELISRIDRLESLLFTKARPLSCFLSYRFNKRSQSFALELTRFLELLDVRVVSGAGYEPCHVNEKVRRRLEQPLDFFVYLITGDGESTWTRDELSYARAKGYAIVWLIEKGTRVEQGLLGNWEYIEFQSDHISDTFLNILEAIRFIREEMEVKLKEADQTAGENEM